MLAGAASLAAHAEDYAAAEPLWREAIALARATGDREGQVDRLCGLGNILAMRGDAAAGMSLMEEALAIAREVGDHRREAGVLGVLANVAMRGEIASR